MLKISVFTLTCYPFLFLLCVCNPLINHIIYISLTNNIECNSLAEEPELVSGGPEEQLRSWGGFGELMHYCHV